jgi:2-hydroxychromene-2-carboxylate isomerase
VIAAREIPLDLPLRSEPRGGPKSESDRVVDSMPRNSPRQVVIYGDFACPWSYLASQRSDALEAAGVSVDWRAVEGCLHPWDTRASRQRLKQVRDAIPEVLAVLGPGESFPTSIARYTPCTAAAVSAFAEGCAAGRSTVIRGLLFDALWVHGADLNNANTLRRLTAPVLMDSASPSAVVREWGMVPDVTGAPVSTAAWSLRREWASAWQHIQSAGTPWLLVDGRPTFGSDAVAWLGNLVRLLPDRTALTTVVPTDRRIQELPPVSWISQDGGRWLRKAHKLTGRIGQ